MAKFTKTQIINMISDGSISKLSKEDREEAVSSLQKAQFQEDEDWTSSWSASTSCSDFDDWDASVC